MASPTVIIVGSAVTALSTEAAIISDGKSALKVRPVIGAFVMAGFLFAISALNASIATNLAVLITVTALLVNGPKLFSVVGRITNG